MQEILQKESMVMNKKEGISFQISAVILLLLLALICLLPILHLVAKSFSDTNAVIAGKVSFVPVGFQLETYKAIAANNLFWRTFLNSIVITLGGTVLSMAVTILAAYPLSKPYFKGRKFILLLYVFSMLFYGGTIPSYIIMQSLGLLNTLWAQIIPFIVVQFNLFILKTGFEGIPDAIEESARMDGAGHFRILGQFYLPLTSPTLVTVALFYAVNYWNGYYHAMLFVTDQRKKPLQLYLYELITSAQASTQELGFEAAANLSSSGMQAAAIVLGMIPVIILYLVAQKYLISGMTIGSVKG